MKIHIPLLALVLTACGGGNPDTEQPTVITPPVETTTTDPVDDDPPPEFGTPLGTAYCANSTESMFSSLLAVIQTLRRNDKVQDFADGQGGSYTEVVSTDSEDCGYTPLPAEGEPQGESYCAGTLTPNEYEPLYNNINHLLPEDRLQDYADGEGGLYTERTVHIDQSCFTQMQKPDDCPTTATSTGDSRYNYLTCDGVKQSTSTSFHYQPDHYGRAIIDMLIVFDTNITEEDRDGMSVREFVDKQIYESNHMYMVSGTYTLVRVTDIIMVDVKPGDLYRQYGVFFDALEEFTGLNEWQRKTQSDLAFLFKKMPEDPVACGVANLNATRGITKSRGITQCFHNSVFQETVATRYYVRAHETFAHELGHLLGAQHEWKDTNNATGLFEYSFGYNLEGYEPQADNTDYKGVWSGYGTIMSYADLPTGRFSNYNVQCEIPETGTQVDLGTDGSCFCLESIQQPPTNNTETIMRTRYIMSQLHETAPKGTSFNMKSVRDDEDICLF
jgi:hypothetical protein